MSRGSPVTWEPQRRGSELGPRLAFETQRGAASKKGKRAVAYVRGQIETESRETMHIIQ